MLIRASGSRKWSLFFQDLKVLLDGVEVKNVIEADDEAGYVEHYVLGPDGKWVEDGNRYKTERLEGAITFVGTKKFSPDDARAAAVAKRDRRQIRNNAIANRNAMKAEGGAA